MEFKEEEEVFAFIKKHSKPSEWIVKARDDHRTLKALVTGDDFTEVLIDKIEGIESDARKIARKRYSKDIRDLFYRVMSLRSNVFTASGGSVNIDIKSEEIKQKINSHIKSFKGQKSLKKYLSEVLFTLLDTDPNGVILIEYDGDKKIEPYYKSINDIRYYKSNGQIVDVILFEPKTVIKDKLTFTVWRLIDDKKDWYVVQSNQSYSVVENKTFDHPFGVPPVVIIGATTKMGKENRISSIDPVVELSKDYARDKSIKTIYKFQHGFPRHWRYVQECRTCHGVGKIGDKVCGSCDGKGHIQRGDVTDTMTLALPRDKEDALVAPNVEGFVSPDLATWERFNTELELFENTVHNTLWGTEKVTQGGNETATGRFIDVQPVINKLNDFADYAEWVNNKLLDFIVSWAMNKPTQGMVSVSYGRRFIIEGSDVILDKYEKARTSGVNNTVLDKLLDEFILAKYHNNEYMLSLMQKKRMVEPYIHQSIDQVFNIFGAKEANKKVLFENFWEECDKNKDVEILKIEFNDYYNEKTAPTELTEIQKAEKVLSLLSPLVATKLLEDMSREERRLLLNITTAYKQDDINQPNI